MVIMDIKLTLWGDSKYTNKKNTIEISFFGGHSDALPKLCPQQDSAERKTLSGMELSKDLKYYIPHIKLETLRNKLRGRFNYELLITCDWAKFIDMPEQPTVAWVTLEIEKVLNIKLLSNVIVYGIYETTKTNKKNIHCHCIISFPDKTVLPKASVDACRRVSLGRDYDYMVYKYFRYKSKYNPLKLLRQKIGMCNYARINSLYHNYKPTECRGLRRSIGNFEKYYGYIHKTLLEPENTDSIYEGTLRVNI